MAGWSFAEQHDVILSDMEVHSPFDRSLGVILAAFANCEVRHFGHVQTCSNCILNRSKSTWITWLFGDSTALLGKYREYMGIQDLNVSQDFTMAHFECTMRKRFMAWWMCFLPLCARWKFAKWNGSSRHWILCFSCAKTMTSGAYFISAPTCTYNTSHRAALEHCDWGRLGSNVCMRPVWKGSPSSFGHLITDMRVWSAIAWTYNFCIIRSLTFMCIFMDI